MSEKSPYIYRIQPTRPDMLAQGPTPREEAIISEHFGYLQELTAQGVALLVGRTLTTDESTFGIVVFRAETEAEAREIMNRDPAVREGVMRAELFPFRIVLTGDFAGA